MSNGGTHIDIPLAGWAQLMVFLAAFTMLADSRPASAQIAEATQAFDEGTGFLYGGHFHEAVAAFDLAEQLGVGSGALFYNRGVAHYRLEEIGQAVRYFERASRLLPDEPRIRHNLDIVAGRLTDRFSQLPVPVWKRVQQGLISYISVPALVETGLILYILFVALVIAKIRGSGQGRWFGRVRAALAVLALSFLAAGFSSSVWPAYQSEAVILARQASMHEQPDADAAVSQLVHEGLVVSTIATGADWVLIQLPNGARGWINANELGEI